MLCALFSTISRTKHWQLPHWQFSGIIGEWHFDENLHEGRGGGNFFKEIHKLPVCVPSLLEVWQTENKIKPTISLPADHYLLGLSLTQTLQFCPQFLTLPVFVCFGGLMCDSQPCDSWDLSPQYCGLWANFRHSLTCSLIVTVAGNQVEPSEIWGRQCWDIYLQLANYGNVSGEMCWLSLIGLRIVFFDTRVELCHHHICQQRGRMTVDRIRLKVKCSILFKDFTSNIVLRC